MAGKTVNFKTKTGNSSKFVHHLPVLHIRLPINPEDAKSQDDKFTLTSTDGKYKKTLTVKDDKVDGDEYIDLIYNNLKFSQKYTLEIDTGAEGEKYNLFENIPYQDLIDYYSELETEDELEEIESKNNSIKIAEINDSEWENDGDSTEYGGDPDDNDDITKIFLERDSEEENEINWNTFDPDKLDLSDVAQDEEEADDW